MAAAAGEKRRQKRKQRKAGPLRLGRQARRRENVGGEVQDEELGQPKAGDGQGGEGEFGAGAAGG